jgi:hypothetical protein
MEMVKQKKKTKGQENDDKMDVPCCELFFLMRKVQRAWVAANSLSFEMKANFCSAKIDEKLFAAMNRRDASFE